MHCNYQYCATTSALYNSSVQISDINFARQPTFITFIQINHHNFPTNQKFFIRMECRFAIFLLFFSSMKISSVIVIFPFRYMISVDENSWLEVMRFPSNISSLNYVLFFLFEASLLNLLSRSNFTMDDGLGQKLYFSKVTFCRIDPGDHSMDKKPLRVSSNHIRTDALELNAILLRQNNGCVSTDKTISHILCSANISQV